MICWPLFRLVTCADRDEALPKTAPASASLPTSRRRILIAYIRLRVRERPCNNRSATANTAPADVGSGTGFPIQTLSNVVVPDWVKRASLRESGTPEKVR